MRGAFGLVRERFAQDAAHKPTHPFHISDQGRNGHHHVSWFRLAHASDLSGDVADWDQVQDGLVGGQGEGVRRPGGVKAA